MSGGFAIRPRRFGNEREIDHQFTAASKIPGDCHTVKFGLGFFKRFPRMLQQSRGTMQVQTAFAARRDSEVLQNLRL